MQFFMDSADIDKIRQTMKIYPCDGVTTNPTILARDTGDPGATLRAIREAIGEKLLFVQVTSSDPSVMIEEARAMRRALGEPLSIKIPATQTGLGVMRTLVAEGFSVTATAVYTEQQALLCAKAGASYVAPYLSHLDNRGLDSAEVIGRMAALLFRHAPETTVLAASFRTASQVDRAMLAGAGAVTITAEMFETLLFSEGTAAEVASFHKNWGEAFGSKTMLSFFS